MSQSDSFKVKCLKLSVRAAIAGAVSGFLIGMQNFSHLQTALIAGLIGGVSLSMTEVVTLLGKTWWLKGLLWGTTMGILVSVLTPGLLPSVNLRAMSIFGYSFTYGFMYYFFNGSVATILKEDERKWW